MKNVFLLCSWDRFVYYKPDRATAAGEKKISQLRNESPKFTYIIADIATLQINQRLNKVS